ncbi:TonB-linked outer membrane protein, SusC/RagA family [Draconibacterium orientale]|uniref:Membrane protein n=1 Tax=Draconibacterium orientale TaxID=1168034 RepID=X5DYJ8_9BACT|nr:TonB-dependent receptor [Draconibacterium orientale]AHW59381.1 membrane protein [Draconibacterium orientale]SEU06594.1 TonB-linked outer membrane protein, SusC/RagA family [Draconibacterium orientale]
MRTKLLKFKIPLFFLVLLLGFNLSVQAQNAIDIRGVVSDASGDPLPGVNIVIKGTLQGTLTDPDGNYKITVPGNDAVLVFSFIGYNSQEITVGNQRAINVSLKEDLKQLDEVVVIGYGSVARKDVTTAVSTVSTKEIDERPIVSAAQVIQGKAAGVNVYQPNGAPGGEMVIRVRGTTSFNGSNNPLYVVDGVPVDNLNFLSPMDIASMQILKDASSAAIYGSRAANGVILITTKQASGEAKISLNTQFGVSHVANQIESLNAAQYKELMDEIRPGAIPEGTTDQTDWFDEVYGTGITQNYQLQISDGNDKTRYFISGGYLNEKGVLSSAFFRRYNLRSNLESQVRSWLNIGLNLSYSDNTRNGVTTGAGSNRGGVVLSVVNLPTASNIIDPETGLYNRTFFGQNIVNPIESIENGKNNKNNENRLIASGSSTITFLPELTLKSSFTLDRRNGKNTGFNPPVHGSDRDDWGNAWDTRSTNTLLVFDNVMTFKKTFADKHNFEAMAGTSWTDSQWSQSYVNGSHFKDDNIHTLNAANKIAWDNTGSGASAWGIMSVFGRLSYNYESKYLFTFNIREDGSSKLHPDYRWGTFPSFSLAWRMSSEEFMQGLTWLDDLKIRGGWGQTGNQSGVGDYAYLQRYNITRQAWFETGKEDALPLITQANLRTSDLTWETTSQVNLGLDATLFADRVTIAMDYYSKHTEDMLMYVSLPAGAAAASNIVRNEGEMMNRGVEFSVSSRNFTGAFTWSTDFNISHNTNELKSLELQQIYYDAETTDAFHQIRVVRNEPGRALGGFYGYISDGVDPETGELMYRDTNEDGKITASDRTYIGDPNPAFTFGLTNTFSYKGFSLNVFLQGSVGNDIFNASKGDVMGMYDLKNQSREVLERWRTPGQITDVPKAGFVMQPSSYFIEDGSYLRVKDITFSYNFNGGILNKLGVSRLQPYVTATNLLTLTDYSGMDPEVNQWGNSGAVQGIDWGTYPHSKTFVFGLNVEF